MEHINFFRKPIAATVLADDRYHLEVSVGSLDIDAIRTAVREVVRQESKSFNAYWPDDMSISGYIDYDGDMSKENLEEHMDRIQDKVLQLFDVEIQDLKPWTSVREIIQRIAISQVKKMVYLVGIHQYSEDNDPDVPIPYGNKTVYISEKCDII